MLTRSLPGHVALALTTGLVFGIAAARYHTVILPPYAAILGALVDYPATRCGLAAFASTEAERPMTSKDRIG